MVQVQKANFRKRFAAQKVVNRVQPLPYLRKRKGERKSPEPSGQGRTHVVHNGCTRATFVHDRKKADCAVNANANVMNLHPRRRQGSGSGSRSGGRQRCWRGKRYSGSRGYTLCLWRDAAEENEAVAVAADNKVTLMAMQWASCYGVSVLTSRRYPSPG